MYAHCQTRAGVPENPSWEWWFFCCPSPTSNPVNAMSSSSKEQEDQIQQELRRKQKFTMSGAIGRSAGGAMKGASPIPAEEQGRLTINQYIDDHLKDPSGALKSMLKRRVKAQTRVVEAHVKEPLAALREIVEGIISRDAVLVEFVRQVDVRWGEMFMERPHFQQPGQAPHPDDEYTHSSVKDDLSGLLATMDPP